MRHSWRVVQFVQDLIRHGLRRSVSRTVDFTRPRLIFAEFLHNVDELLESMFLVLSISTAVKPFAFVHIPSTLLIHLINQNELLLTRLLLCSRIVFKHLNVYNTCYLLTEAIHFNVTDLADRIQSCTWPAWYARDIGCPASRVSLRQAGKRNSG